MTIKEFYGNAAGDIGLLWPGAVAAVYGHRSGAAYGTSWGCSNSSSTYKNFASAEAHPIVGVAVANNNPVVANQYITLSGDTGATAHLTVQFDANTVYLKRGASNGTIIATYNYAATGNAFLAATWYFFEIEATVADSGGICIVRLNQTEIINFTGDTKNGGTNTTIDRITVGQTANANACLCDVYIANNSGSAPGNTFLGDVRMVKSRPSAAGASTQFTPDSGSNYARVNESPYSAANYVSSATSGQVDSYVMEDLPASINTVYAVKSGMVAKNPDGGLAQVKNMVRHSGVNHYGSQVILGASDAIIQTFWEQNPGTSAPWTVANVNALESGMQRV